MKCTNECQLCDLLNELRNFMIAKKIGTTSFELYRCATIDNSQECACYINHKIDFH